MSYAVASLRALKLVGLSQVTLTTDLGPVVVKTDADSIRPDLADLGPCRCNVLLWSLCSGTPGHCQCPRAFAKALGPVGPKIHLVLLYGIQSLSPAWAPKCHENHTELASVMAVETGCQAVLYAGRHKSLKINFKSQQFLTMGHKDREVLLQDFKKQLAAVN